MKRCHVCLLFAGAATLWLPSDAAVTTSRTRRHLRPDIRKSVSFVEDRFHQNSDAAQRQFMGRVVAHGGQLFMNTAVPGQIWALSPDYTTSSWMWKPSGSVYSADLPGLPVNPPTLSFAGPSPGPGGAMATVGVPAPAPASAPGPAPGPGGAGGVCESLKGKAEQTPGAQGMFLNCQEFRYYGDSVFGKTAPYGCHCASWTVNCPFETCPVGTAFDSTCLSPDVKGMGFTALSKLSNYINPGSVPKALRPYTVHPDYISTCMYWLPKPANPGMPAVNSAAYASHLPDFATFFFDGISLFACADQISDEHRLSATKAGLLRALAQPSLSILSITCGSLSALVTGPASEIAAAAKIASNPSFCWQAVTLPVCTTAPSVPTAPAAPGGAPSPFMAPSPYPGPGGGVHPGPAPGPAPAR